MTVKVSMSSVKDACNCLKLTLLPRTALIVFRSHLTAAIVPQEVLAMS